MFSGRTQNSNTLSDAKGSGLAKAWKLSPWRSPRKLLRELQKTKVVFFFERRLANLVVLQMMRAAQANGPPIRRLEPNTSIRATPNMSALDRQPPTAGDRAAMLPHPVAVGSGVS